MFFFSCNIPAFYGLEYIRSWAMGDSHCIGDEKETMEERALNVTAENKTDFMISILLVR